MKTHPLDTPVRARRGVLHITSLHKARHPLGDGQPVGAAALPVGQQQLPGMVSSSFLISFGVTKQSSGQSGVQGHGGMRPVQPVGHCLQAPASHSWGRAPQGTREKWEMGQWRQPNGGNQPSPAQALYMSLIHTAHPRSLHPPTPPPSHLPPLPPTDLRRTWVWELDAFCRAFSLLFSPQDISWESRSHCLGERS